MIAKIMFAGLIMVLSPAPVEKVPLPAPFPERPEIRAILPEDEIEKAFAMHRLPNYKKPLR